MERSAVFSGRSAEAREEERGWEEEEVEEEAGLVVPRCDLRQDEAANHRPAGRPAERPKTSLTSPASQE